VQRVFTVEHYNLPEWVQEHNSRFSWAKQIDSIPPGEPFPSQQKLFSGIHQTWINEQMHTPLNAADISNTKYNSFCFLILV
jgi:hypothetical protein